MRILHASAELYPYAKTGGLADMVAALAKTLARAGHQVGVVLPLYRGVRERFPELRPFDWRLNLPLGGQMFSASVWVAHPRPHLDIYFIDQPQFFNRADLYQERGVPYADNAERFAFFCKCVAHFARYLPWQPELVHLHDWHAGLAPVLIRHQAATEAWLQPPRTCLTIHNLAFQGNFPSPKHALTNLPWSYFSLQGVEFHGELSFLKGAINFADAITTVSPRYAQEITTPDHGCGLDGTLRERGAILTGILNGADYDEWRTTRNPFLRHAYTAANLAGKGRGKAALQTELRLPVRPQAPLFGSITRLAHQKGVDIALPALQELLVQDIQLALLGTGLPQFEKAFVALAKLHPTKVAVRIAYDQGLAHRIEAGADFFLMPSQFEPCGLNQMYSLRYGTLPIVRATGGLDDSVVDLREDPIRANGIKFHQYAPAALAKAMRKGLAVFGEPDLLRHLRRNGMAANFSWEETARRYLEVYHQALAR